MADKPVTREEKYLAYLTGDYKGELPKPITRKEKYLYELCLKGIGGEISPEEIKNAVNEYLEKNPIKPGATTEQVQQIEQNKTDVASLKEDLGNVESVTFTIEKGSANVFDCTNITSGKILKQDIGISTSETYQDSAKGFVANQIWDVKKGDIIYTTATYCGLCIYDASGTLQEHFNDGNKNHTVTVDSARFLRYYCSSSSSTYTTDFMLSIDEPLPSTYEAYKPDKKYRIS